jgi:DNA polymerase III sliding clamp (beta) subunit (PCNA family)
MQICIKNGLLQQMVKDLEMTKIVSKKGNPLTMMENVRIEAKGTTLRMSIGNKDFDAMLEKEEDGINMYVLKEGIVFVDFQELVSFSKLIDQDLVTIQNEDGIVCFQGICDVPLFKMNDNCSPEMKDNNFLMKGFNESECQRALTIDRDGVRLISECVHNYDEKQVTPYLRKVVLDIRNEKEMIAAATDGKKIAHRVVPFSLYKETESPELKGHFSLVEGEQFVMMKKFSDKWKKNEEHDVRLAIKWTEKDIQNETIDTWKTYVQFKDAKYGYNVVLSSNSDAWYYPNYQSILFSDSPIVYKVSKKDVLDFAKIAYGMQKKGRKSSNPTMLFIADETTLTMKFQTTTWTQKSIPLEWIKPAEQGKMIFNARALYIQEILEDLNGDVVLFGFQEWQEPYDRAMKLSETVHLIDGKICDAENFDLLMPAKLEKEELNAAGLN